MGQQSDARHELGNQIGIALANIEGMIDGLVSPTASRLEAVADALREARRLLQASEPIP
ncbi:MAG: hypothetical protein JO190_08855 [Candidatus Eremiobacteraeota bacterium]|nr:hypothetical protein [Candidatus Eremiobacteraeota bacterium]MBV8499069.1 hypothetical protein [Candidatus Eremiobacteraeota bacterium]